MDPTDCNTILTGKFRGSGFQGSFLCDVCRRLRPSRSLCQGFFCFYSVNVDSNFCTRGQI